MLLSSFQGGVVEDEWLLLDDFIHMDTQFVALQGLASEPFQLPCGTAQGKRFSAFVFNAQVKWLADAVGVVLPQGCAAWVPAVYRRACPVGADPAPSFPLRAPPPPRPSLLLRASQVGSPPQHWARSRWGHVPRRKWPGG